MQNEADFAKKKAKLEAAYEKKHADLSISLIDYETKEKNQYELKLKDAKLLARKKAKADVAATQKDYNVQLKKAKTMAKDAAKLVVPNLV